MSYKDNETWAQVIVTDQGNGATYCGQCGENFDKHGVLCPKECPKCRRKVVDSNVWINQGGSDF
jgi:hypothetical protein